jgi:sortase A
VRKKGTPSDLSIEELRRLLVEKRRAPRLERMDHFRRTGRVVVLAPDVEGQPLGNLRSGAIPTGGEGETIPPAPSRRKRFLDPLLLGVEITAVLGLLFVLFNGITLIRELNQEVAAVLAQPTMTPTPLVGAVVLPSGHTPPNSPGGARPNDAEIPDHLRPLVQSLAEIPLPTPGLEQATRIQIPAIDVDAPIVQGDGWEQLKKGVGQHIGTANPGKEGNLVLSAHNDIYGELFRELDFLESGDQVVIFTNQRSYTYIVSQSRIVEPTQVDVMDQTSQPTVTLISCYPYMVDKQRIVVTARLQSGSNE